MSELYGNCVLLPRKRTTSVKSMSIVFPVRLIPFKLILTHMCYFSNSQSPPDFNLVVYFSQFCFVYHKQKRVNTLTKKFEWDYFEALSTQSLPVAEEKLHRQKVCHIKTIVSYTERNLGIYLVLPNCCKNFL